MGLRKALTEHNFPDLTKNLDWKLVMESKLGLKHALQKLHGDDNEAKLTHVKRILARFQDGSLPRNLRHKENLVAATAVFVELNGTEVTAK